MSQPSRRLRRQELNEQKVAQRRAARRLRQRHAVQGLERRPTSTIANGRSAWKTAEQERQGRQEAVEEQLKVYRSVLPVLLKRLAKIRDPRNPKAIKHKSTVLMLYGILAFVFQMASRREANRQMTLPVFQENLHLMFPELETLPHQDTLNRLLSKIEVDEIEKTLLVMEEEVAFLAKIYRIVRCTPDFMNIYPLPVAKTKPRPNSRVVGCEARPLPGALQSGRGRLREHGSLPSVLLLRQRPLLAPNIASPRSDPVKLPAATRTGDVGRPAEGKRPAVQTSNGLGVTGRVAGVSFSGASCLWSVRTK